MRWLRALADRYWDWYFRAVAEGYDRAVLEQVEKEVCGRCPKRNGCIGPVPLGGGVFPCRKAAEAYFERVEEM